jgi:obg-like ATPase 1
MIPYSADFEAQVVAGCQDPDDEAEKNKFAKELGAPSMIDRLIKAGYKNLKLIHYFTAGEDEVKCWTIRDGTKAPGAAGVIHTDFEKGFICADCMKFEDLDRCGSTQGVKDEGLYRQNGKEYVVLDGDIMHFKFNVSTAKPKKEK